MNDPFGVRIKFPVNLQKPGFKLGQAIPLQTWPCPYGFRRLIPPEFLYNRDMRVVTL